MKQFLLILVTLLILGFPAHTYAHLGGGPPFLKIDGKNANTNPYNQGASTITVPWDVPPDTYLINTPITFAIDVPELMKATTAPAELAKEVKIRWSFATGENFTNKEGDYLTGSTIEKTFTKSGSYLVIIEAKLPADSDFILINTVQVDILPKVTYQLPSASVYIGTQYDDVKKNVLLVSNGSINPSVKIKKYLWDFGEGRLEEGKLINRKFNKTETVGVEQVFHRVMDENGFISDVGFIAENRNGTLKFSASNNSGNYLPINTGTYVQAEQLAGKKPQMELSIIQFIGVAAIAIILICAGWWWFLTNKK